MRVQIFFDGEPFSRAAVIHTLRHLAMRVGWELTLDANADQRIVYATTDNPGAVASREQDVVILSTRTVAEHLRNSRDPIPLAENGLPFPHPTQYANWICADVIAGACAAMNLWYEQRAREQAREGWITWREDWMAHAGFTDPLPLADQWLDEIARAGERLGWRTSESRTPFTVVLSHDVDYLPSPRDFGLPRLGRALMRQIVSRRRPRDAITLLARFARTWRAQPYLAFESVMREEAKRGARSSFQLVAARHHGADPAYASDAARIAQKIAQSDWELALHSSYTASRVQGQIRDERAKLESVAMVPVIGNRQHYLNFAPAHLFDQVERADLQYDSSVGYNEMSGARAGTYRPYRPFDFTRDCAYNFWEIPFVLMDTTLATTYRFSPRAALEHSKKILACVAETCGCVAIIWHLEQLSGLVDPGFDQVYFDLLDWIRVQGGAMVTGRDAAKIWDTHWRATMPDG